MTHTTAPPGQPGTAARCTATTSRGAPCRNRPTTGNTVCQFHGGTKKTIGRPSALTTEVQARFVEVLSIGSDRAHACQYAGISTATFYGWLERAEADKEMNRTTDYTEFSDAIAQAEAQAKMLHVANLRRHVVGFKDGDGRWHQPDPKVSMWWLERMGGAQWQQNGRVEVEANVKTSRREELEPLSPEEQQAHDAEVADVLAAIGALPSVLTGEAPESEDARPELDALLDDDE